MLQRLDDVMILYIYGAISLSETTNSSHFYLRRFTSQKQYLRSLDKYSGDGQCCEGYE